MKKRSEKVLDMLEIRTVTVSQRMKQQGGCHPSSSCPWVSSDDPPRKNRQVEEDQRVPDHAMGSKNTMRQEEKGLVVLR
ncbi:hypothetical protein RUM44_001959 [Polyplax serrata]|uniref:Uncharacterized protein n=1 Tax=Polyplax serrata TaxID=468196 RepID=A0ABR1ALJ1_POLSC